MKKLLFILIVVAAAGIFQIAGLQPSAHAEWGEDVLVTNYISDSNSIKPSMTAASNGDLYIAVEDVESTEIRLYKSTDGGETWADLFWIGFNLLNPSLAYAAGAENWVFITYEVLSTDNSRSIELHRFDPANPTNDSWSTVASGIYMPSGIHIQPEICTDAIYWPDATYVYVTYSIEGLTYYPVYFSRSMDYGQTWSEPMEVTGYVGMSSGWQTQPDIAYGPSGLYIAFEKMGWNGTSWTNQIWVAKSTDYGATWNTPVQVPASISVYDTYHPRIAVASNGVVMVVYTMDDGVGSTFIGSNYSTDGGTTWNFEGFPVTFDPEEVELSVSTSNGRFHAAYYDQNLNILYSWASVTNPELGWLSQSIRVDDYPSWVSSNYKRPAVCPNPTLPVEFEACVAWTDIRNILHGGYYDVYFDHVPPCGNEVIDSGEDCDDGNTLNGDCCSAECKFEPNGSPCDNPASTDCSAPDTCNGSGFCLANDYPEGTQCTSDGNMCTDDACNDYGLCLHYPNTDPCDDGNACTIADTCSNWSCVGGPALNCDDGNVCTTDSCNTISGCVHTNNTVSCSDGLYCNGTDTCSGGSCSIHSGDPCFPISCDEITNTCSGSDFDGDGVPDSLDNCTYQYNPGQEDLDSDGMGDACDNCIRNYNPGQEDTCPPQTNGCGDVCECEGNFNGWEDQDVDGSDAFIFKTDFGRSRILNPCTNADPCNGDFFCEADVDGTDAFQFKSDFGRSSILNPCPYCVTVPWCVYP